MMTAPITPIVLAVALSICHFCGAEQPTGNDPAAIAALVAALRSEDFDQRAAAAERLRALDVAALPVLEAQVAAEKDPDSRVQLAAAVEHLRIRAAVGGKDIAKLWEAATTAATEKKDAEAIQAFGWVRMACSLPPPKDVEEPQRVRDIRRVISAVERVPECTDAALAKVLAGLVRASTKNRESRVFEAKVLPVPAARMEPLLNSLFPLHPDWDPQMPHMFAGNGGGKLVIVGPSAILDSVSAMIEQMKTDAAPRKRKEAP